ncbi:MAG TPA: helix-turn-helix domain-containing protein [Acidimicrobiia bacterium]|nr:helix-turn-helix domain-containing protein [Acidimicrobiia bacterium]
MALDVQAATAPGGGARRTRAPGRDTRAEILRVASELFVEQGYDATSLRQIAERLHITKAALYYHFASKDDILHALMQPLEETVSELVDRLERARNLSEFADALTWLVEMFLDHMDFFRLLERNRHAVEEMHKAVQDLSEHLQMHERIRAAVHETATDVHEEIRMVTALGAVTAFDDWAPKLLAEAPPEIVVGELSTAVRAILQLPKRRDRRPRPIGTT